MTNPSTLPGSFRAAVESKQLPAIAATLDPAIEFNSPVMVRPYQGKDTVVAILGVLLEVFEDFRYTDELVSTLVSPGHDGSGAPPTHALIFSARVLGKDVQGLDLIRFGEPGLVTRLTVMIRPLPAVMTLARVVGRRMEEHHAALA